MLFGSICNSVTNFFKFLNVLKVFLKVFKGVYMCPLKYIGTLYSLRFEIYKTEVAVIQIKFYFFVIYFCQYIISIKKKKLEILWYDVPINLKTGGG